MFVSTPHLLGSAALIHSGDYARVSPTQPAWCSNAQMTISRGYTLVCVSVSRNIFPATMRRFCASRKRTTQLSAMKLPSCATLPQKQLTAAQITAARAEAKKLTAQIKK